jgi:hypothetical protein
MERKQFTTEQIIQILKEVGKSAKRCVLTRLTFGSRSCAPTSGEKARSDKLARVFGVSLGFFQSLLQRYRTGGVEPKPHGGRNPGQISQHASTIFDF